MIHFHRSLAAASLLVLAAAAGLGVPIAHAQTVMPNPTAMVITTSPYVINGSGFYQLGANLTYNGNGSTNDAIITINAPNVTLDLGGHYISGPGTNPATGVYGIYANGQANLILQNGTVSHCRIGVYLNGSSGSTPNNLNQTIRNLLVTNCYMEGIDVEYAVGANLNGNNVYNIGGSTFPQQNHVNAFGIVVSGGSGAIVTNNKIGTITNGAMGSAYAIFCPSGNSTVSFNTISNLPAPNGGAAYGISKATFAVGNTLSIIGNTSAATSGYGIYNCTFYKDNLTDACATPFSGGTAVGTYNN